MVIEFLPEEHTFNLKKLKKEHGRRWREWMMKELRMRSLCSRTVMDGSSPFKNQCRQDQMRRPVTHLIQSFQRSETNAHPPFPHNCQDCIRPLFSNTSMSHTRHEMYIYFSRVPLLTIFRLFSLALIPCLDGVPFGYEAPWGAGEGPRPVHIPKSNDPMWISLYEWKPVLCIPAL